MEISDKTTIGMPIRNLIAITTSVALGVWAYFGVIERLNILETNRQLMEADLLKKAEQTPKNLEIYMLIEMNAKQIEKHSQQLEENLHTQVMLDHMESQLEKLMKDVEKLKDATRSIEFANGNGH
jgi:predicted TIM-barrel fold metal-dependent hydrolase